MPTVEVRCCCDANRLMGDMEVERVCREGRWACFWSPDGEFIASLEWGRMKYGTGHVCPGLKSGGVPIETLRTIPEFKERSE